MPSLKTAEVAEHADGIVLGAGLTMHELEERLKEIEPKISGTVQSAQRLYPSRLLNQNFACHVTFLDGISKEIA